MKLLLMTLFFIFAAEGTKTPNFYPSYLAAREASKNYKKDMVLFFTKQSCPECTTAWSQFEKDEMATKVFISTMVDGYGFDGAVMLDKYGMTSVPCWVVMDYEGQVKQKWNGDWKNPYSRPTEPAKTETAAAKPLTVFQPTTATKETTPPAPKNTPAPVAPANPIPENKEMPAAVAPSASAMENGFVLQAGYFGSEVNAQKLMADLEQKGFSEYVMKSTVQNGSTFYRVISKTYTSEMEANAEMNKLAEKGVKASMKKSSELK